MTRPGVQGSEPDWLGTPSCMKQKRPIKSRTIFSDDDTFLFYPKILNRDGHSKRND